MDESGHWVGTGSTRIIIDSTLRTKLQVHPGRQEWISTSAFVRTEQIRYENMTSYGLSSASLTCTGNYRAGEYWIT